MGLGKPFFKLMLAKARPILKMGWDMLKDVAAHPLEKVVKPTLKSGWEGVRDFFKKKQVWQAVDDSHMAQNVGSGSVSIATQTAKEAAKPGLLRRLRRMLPWGIAAGSTAGGIAAVVSDDDEAQEKPEEAQPLSGGLSFVSLVIGAGGLFLAYHLFTSSNDGHNPYIASPGSGGREPGGLAGRFSAAAEHFGPGRDGAKAASPTRFGTVHEDKKDTPGVPKLSGVLKMPDNAVLS